MKTLIFLLTFFISMFSYGQISYSQNWSASGLNSWTSQNGSFSRTTQMICATTASVRANIYSTNATGNFASPLLSGNNGGLVTVSYLYKVINYSSPNGATPATFGTLKVQYASALAGPWTDVPGSTVNNSNHSPSTSCQTQVVQFTPALGNVYIRFNVVWSTGDYYMYFDDVTISQGSAPSCTTPTSLTSSSVGSSTATISWTAASPAPSNGYQYFLSTSPTAPSAGTTPTGSTAAGVVSVNLSSLSTSTLYYFWVRSNCGGTQSTWAGSSTFTTGPPNNTCANATTLNCSVSNLAGSTIGTTNNAHGISGTCLFNGGVSNYGVWYTFVGDGSSTTITVSPTGFDVEIDVVSGSCGVFTCVNGGTDSGLSGVSESTTFSAINGTTYYIYVAQYLSGNTTTGNFTISRTCVSPPSNNNCSGATSLTVNSTPTCTVSSSGTTLGATQSLVAPVGYGTADDDVWYTFTATGDKHFITVIPGTLVNAVVQVFTGNCSGVTSIGVVDATSGSASEVVLCTGLTIGVTYYVRVYSKASGTGQGTFTICVTSPPSNDEVTGAITLIVNDPYVDGNNVSATSSTTAPTPNGPAYYGGDVWYKFVVPSGGTVLIDMASGTLTDMVMEVYSGTTSSLTYISYNDDSLSFTEYMPFLQLTGLTVGSTIYIRVWDYSGDEEGTFKIRVSTPVGLPVELYEFNGITDGTNNYLYWVTASEQNTSHFNLKHSRDGETWSTITTINGAGNSTNLIEYNVTDYNIESIINYYLLQQYDNDGVYEIFGPISINNINSKTSKTIVKYINLIGQEINPSKLKSLDVYIEIYDDGTMRRVIK